LQEAVSDAQQAKIDLLSEVFADPRVKSMLEQSSMTKQMQNDAKQITAKISSAIYNEAQKVMSARSIEELERLTKKNFGVAQKLQQAPENERQQLEEAMLMQVKAAAKAFYVKQLTTEIQTLQNQGVDSTNIYIRTLQGTLDKVASLK
jgi:regulator of sirC expression with transglutaminase-like and TPR domain